MPRPGSTLVAMTALAVACGRSRPEDAAKAVTPPPAADAAPPIGESDARVVAVGPRSTLGPLERARPRFDATCPRALPQGTQPGHAMGPYRVVGESSLSCATLADPGRELHHTQTFSAHPETREVEHFYLGVDWRDGAPPPACDQLSAAAAAYAVDLLGWTDDDGPRLAGAMAAHLAIPDQWFAFTAHDRTVYFASARSEHQRPLDCTVYVSAHLDNWPTHLRAPIPVR